MKKLSCILVVAFLLAMLSGTVFANQAPSEGRPAAFTPEHTHGYFIWSDDNELHLRTTGRGPVHVYSGMITTDGRFYDIEEKQLENGDHVRIDRDHNRIYFRFTTGKATDGFDFKLHRGNKVGFKLFVDGQKAPIDDIYIGKEDRAPKSNEFELKLHRDHGRDHNPWNR